MTGKMIERHEFHFENDERGIMQVNHDKNLLLVRIEVNGSRFPNPGPFYENMQDALRDFQKQFPERDYIIIEGHWPNGDWAIGIIPYHDGFVMTKKQWQKTSMQRALL